MSPLRHVLRTLKTAFARRATALGPVWPLAGLIVLGVVLRVATIHDGPPFEHHDYRQFDTAAVARNFAEESMNIAYPRVDWRGDTPGYAESEFPLYQFMVAILYKGFGVHESLARLVNVAIYVLIAVMFFCFTQRLYGSEAGIYAVAAYSLAPLSLFFTRTIQPDTLMVFATICTLHFFWVWTDAQRVRWLVLSAAALTIATLIKPPNLYLGLPLAYLAYRRFGWRAVTHPSLWIFGVVVLLAVAVWYWHGYQLWLQFGNSFWRAFLGLPPFSLSSYYVLAKVVMYRVIDLMTTPAGLTLLAIGLFVRPAQGNWVLLFWVVGFAVTIVAAPHNHSGHDYYQLPLLFPVAAWMGSGLAALTTHGLVRRYVLVALLPLVILVNTRAIDGFMSTPRTATAEIAFGRHVQAWTQPTDLGVFLVAQTKLNDPYAALWFQHRAPWGQYLNHDPHDLYLSHRKGWSVGTEQIDATLLGRLLARGAVFVAAFRLPLPQAAPPNEVFEQTSAVRHLLDQNLELVDRSEDWVIYHVRD